MQKPSEFYKTQDELVSFLDNFQSIYSQQTGKSVKKKKVKKVFVNPILADGTRKRGRPRKDANNPPKPKKQKNEGTQTGGGDLSKEVTKEKRGTKRKVVDDLDGDDEVLETNEEVVLANLEPKPAKRRGRPPKKRKISEGVEEPAASVERRESVGADCFKLAFQYESDDRTINRFVRDHSPKEKERATSEEQAYHYGRRARVMGRRQHQQILVLLRLTSTRPLEALLMPTS